MKRLTLAIITKRDGQEWYLAHINDETGGWTKYEWSSLPQDAITDWQTTYHAEKIAGDCGGRVVTREACPKCDGLLTDRPAISREDNQTEICPSCGIREAMEAFENSKN